MAATIWDSANSAANLVLSGGNLIVASNSGTFGSARATKGFLAGSGSVNANLKIYYESTILVTGASFGAQVGWKHGGSPTSNFLGGSSLEVGLEGHDGIVRQNGATAATYFAFVAGDVIGMALDFVNQKAWWTKNGTTWNNAVIGSQNPVTNTGGFSTANVCRPSGAYGTVYAAFGNLDNGDSVQANFGALPYAYPIPAGFTSYDPQIFYALRSMLIAG